MHRIAYTDRPPPPAPRVYCDTSFLLDLYSHSRITRGLPARITGTQRQRLLHVRAFVNEAKNNGTVFVSSIFAVEEAFQKLLFQPVYEAMQQHATRFNKWKDFRTGDQAGFQQAIGFGRGFVVEFDSLIQQENIEILQFGRQTAQLSVLEHQVISFAREILRLYDTEAMDAFHYAVMRRFGITHAASSDVGWLAFPNGTLITAN